MKMEPNGSTPPSATSTGGRAYHRLSGISRGIALTRHGASAPPDQCRPKTVPKAQSGTAEKSQMATTAASEPSPTEPSEPYAVETALSSSVVAAQAAGKREAV